MLWVRHVILVHLELPELIEPKPATEPDEVALREAAQYQGVPGKEILRGIKGMIKIASGICGVLWNVVRLKGY
jgi:hypothetical protein